MGKALSIIIGITLVLWGLSVITGIDFPVFQIGAGAFLIILGIKIILKK